MFVVGALVEFAIVVVLSRRKQIHRNDVEKPSMLMAKKIRQFGVHPRRRMKLEHRISKRSTHKVYNEGSNKEDNENNGKEIVMLNSTPVHMIDFMAFCLFIFMYMVFNFVYWHQF